MFRVLSADSSQCWPDPEMPAVASAGQSILLPLKPPNVAAFICLVYVCARTQVWRTEDSMQKLGLSVHHVSTRDQAQIAGPDSKFLYLLYPNSATRSVASLQ